MHMQRPIVRGRRRTMPKGRTSTTVAAFKRSSIVICSLILVVGVGVILLLDNPIIHVLAVGIAPSKPTSIDGSSGNQQVSLTWGAATNATGYLVEQTDLVTGQIQQLPDVVTTTSLTVGSLTIGRWYRFRIIPVNGTIQGMPSDPIEIRTTGFRGSYDHYYALGDSYTSGEGAPPYSGIADCVRSVNSYAYQLGTGIPTPVMIACSGAVTDNIDKTVQHPILPGTQLQQLQSSPLSNSLITLTIGGNDVGFANELKTCIFGLHSCTSRQAVISQKITALEPRLVQVFQEIRVVAPGADIIVLGYPLLFASPNGAHCHNPIIAVGVNGSEMTMIRQLADQMDTVITQAASQAGVVAAASGVEQGFAGHEACTANEQNEWINEITGLTDMVHGSFHPEKPGYLADALAVNARRTSLYLTGMVRRS
ncbi:MAG TPA: GDSL-type esterase/lipase family protein [Ktedonobacteraceae bacterium]|nr:GDSL-type esterase/lipase family protein [Ktedonobacteraceae bacterium]